MMIQRESSLVSTSGNKLFIKSWHSSEKPKAVVVLVHGFGEHCSRYTPYVELFEKQNISFVSYDQHGHGQSGGKRGTIVSYEQLLDDVELILAKAQGMFPDAPTFLYGHSMGGNIALNYILQRTPKISGAIITSPWLKLHKEHPLLLRNIVSVIKNILPNTTIESGLDTDFISTIKAEVDAYNNDKLNHGKMSFRLVDAITKQGAWAIENIDQLKLPMFLAHGTADQITSHKASQETAKRNKALIEFVEFKGIYHEIHNDTTREDLANQCMKWIAKNI